MVEQRRKNATRSLLNTAKLIEKIDKLTVFGGLDGVMKQRVSLKQ